MEDASARGLSNTTIPDSPENASQIDCFGEHQQELIAEGPAEAFHAGINPHEGEEVMEMALPDGVNVSSGSSDESDSNEGTLRCCHSDSVSQAEEEGEDREKSTEELTGEPAVGPAEGPIEETTVGCPALG